MERSEYSNYPVIDREGVIERLGGDEELWMDVVEICLEDFPSQEAALKTALDTGDLYSASMRAHAIKGMVANIGAEQTRFLAAEIEKACKVKDGETAVLIANDLEKAFEELKALLGKK